MTQSMIAEAQESLDQFLDATEGVDCRRIPGARRNLARMAEGLQDLRQELTATKVALDAAKAAPQSTELLEAVTKLTKAIEEGGSPETSLDQIRADLDTPDPVLAQAHQMEMAKVESRRDILLAMAPGATQWAAFAVGLATSAAIGLMI